MRKLFGVLVAALALTGGGLGSQRVNVSRDNKLFAGDGGDPGQVAFAKHGMWINAFHPQHVIRPPVEYDHCAAYAVSDASQPGAVAFAGAALPHAGVAESATVHADANRLNPS